MPALIGNTYQARGITQGSSGWAIAGGGNMYAPYNANVVWQDTSSNATYCSAKSALKVIGG